MKIETKNIEIQVKDNLMDSLKFKGKELLNTTKVWTKKAPVLFPAIGLGKEFKVGEQVYKLPKHGYWNDIDFKVDKEFNGIILNGKVEHPTYPFKIEVEQYIIASNNSVNFLTTTTGPDVPIQFGYHPAFNYDLGGLKLKAKAHTVNLDGSTSKMDIDISNVNDLPWDKVDTFIVETKEVILENKDEVIKVSTNMKYIALWTNGDKYLCIEPWSNLSALVDKDDNTTMESSPFEMKIEIEEK